MSAKLTSHTQMGAEAVSQCVHGGLPDSGLAADVLEFLSKCVSCWPSRFGNTHRTRFDAPVPVQQYLVQHRRHRNDRSSVLGCQPMSGFSRIKTTPSSNETSFHVKDSTSPRRMPDSKIAMNKRRSLSEHALKSFFNPRPCKLRQCSFGDRNRSTVAAGLTVSRLPDRPSEECGECPQLVVDGPWCDLLVESLRRATCTRHFLGIDCAGAAVGVPGAHVPVLD